MNDAASATGPDSGDLAIGCFASLCRDRLADRLLAFSRAMPGAGIGVHEQCLAELLPGVCAGRTSLAVAPADTPMPGKGATLRSARLWDETVLVAMAADHPLAREARLMPDALLDTVMLLSTDGTAGEMGRYLLARLFPGERPAIDARQGQGDVLARVAQGAGVALVLAGHAVSPGMVTRPIDSPVARFAVRAWWCGRNQSPALAALLRLLPG